jgi:hypothetical protein
MFALDMENVLTTIYVNVIQATQVIIVQHIHAIFCLQQIKMFVLAMGNVLLQINVIVQTPTQ